MELDIALDESIIYTAQEGTDVFIEVRHNEVLTEITPMILTVYILTTILYLETAD